MLFNLNFRYKTIALLAALIIIILILIFGALPDINLFWNEVQNSGHTFLFIPITLLTLLLLQDTATFFKKKSFTLYITTFFISLLIGIAIELLQLITHGDASKIDVIRDIAGIIVGLSLYASMDTIHQTYHLKSEKKKITGIIMLSFCVFTASMLPLAFLSAAYVQRAAAFPIIADLTANWIQPFLRLKNATINLPENNEIKTNLNDHLARIDFKPGIYPGISIIETSPDWSAYKTLTIMIYSELIQPFNLTLRIHDDQHNYAYTDRFNTKLTVHNGMNHYRIPLEEIMKAPVNREMNMMRIREIILFSAQPVVKLHFYVSTMRLE